MIFYIGLHRPNHAKHFERAFISVNVIRNRRKPIGSKQWIMDSGAFTEISTHGKYRYDVSEYADVVNRWALDDDALLCAVSQDFMCEPWILQKTGLSVLEHQQQTIERYVSLCKLVKSTYIMPVLQGYRLIEYIDHIKQYGDLLIHGAYVGVGSVCKRNTDVSAVEMVLKAIKSVRSDLRLHGFGVKVTSLRSALVRKLLYSSDSMAWSFAARREGRDQNSWIEAKAYVDKVNALMQPTIT